MAKIILIKSITSQAGSNRSLWSIIVRQLINLTRKGIRQRLGYKNLWFYNKTKTSIEWQSTWAFRKKMLKISLNWCTEPMWSVLRTPVAQLIKSSPNLNQKMASTRERHSITTSSSSASDLLSTQRPFAHLSKTIKANLRTTSKRSRHQSEPCWSHRCR